MPSIVSDYNEMDKDYPNVAKAEGAADARRQG